MLIRLIIAGLFFMLLGCAKDPGSKTKLPDMESKNRIHPNNFNYKIPKSILDDYGIAIHDFYLNHDSATLWTDEKDRKAFLASIKAVETDGLMPEDYYYEKLALYENNKFLKEKECVAYDMLMTKAFYRLAGHLFKGKVAALSIYPDWALPQKQLNVGKLLSEGLENHTIDEVLERCRPPHAVYAGLKKSLKYLRSLPDDSDLAHISIKKAPKLNDSLSEIVILKKRLAYWKDLDNTDISPVYNRETIKAIKKFQARHGIYPNGILSESTIKALNTSKKQREQQVIVNLERWRWFAYDFGNNAIIINIPNYALSFVEDKDTIAVHKIVVGKPDRRTPVLYSKLNYLVINPTWTVPPTILAEDLTPKATEDRNYFTQHNMKIYDAESNEVAPEEWIPEKATSYRYVQSSGSHNALGNIKFNFRNPFSVYLHDTNHREYFNRSKRALSSGCVRVDKPFELAGKILEKEDGDWTNEKIQEMVTLGETENIYLKKTNYIHQLYWTAWMDKSGLQFRSDIYNLDKALYKKLRNQL